jgi:hypothetical protein
MDGHTSHTALTVPADRKIAKYRRKDMTPDHRATILNDLQSEVEQTQATDMTTAFNDAARAISEALHQSTEPNQSHEERLRRQYGGELLVLVNQITNLIRGKNLQDANKHYARFRNSFSTLQPWIPDKPINISARALTQAWEKQVWQRMWEVDWSLEHYADQMEMEIADLGLWVEHFDSELDGYEMFREHFYRNFREDHTVLKNDAVEKLEKNGVKKGHGMATVEMQPPMLLTKARRPIQSQKPTGNFSDMFPDLPMFATGAKRSPRPKKAEDMFGVDTAKPLTFGSTLSQCEGQAGDGAATPDVEMAE